MGGLGAGGGGETTAQLGSQEEQEPCNAKFLGDLHSAAGNIQLRL